MRNAHFSILFLFLIIGGSPLSLNANSKSTPNRIDEEAIKDKISFGNQRSHIEIYVFTDWLCPACKQIEGTLKQIVDQLGSRARIIFVDLPVNKESVNFTPINLYLLMNHKDRYFSLRKAFENLADNTPAPTDMDLRRVFGSFGITYRVLPFTDISNGTLFFKRMAKEFEVDVTPTIIVVNSKTKIGKKFRLQDITIDNISRTIASLS